jgi:hypothetical protein
MSKAAVKEREEKQPSLLQQFDRWWFGYGSPVTFGVFRILIATVALINLLMVSIDFGAWYTEYGYVPLEVTRQWMGDHPRLNVFVGITNPHVTMALYALITLSALLTAIGLWTRVSSIILAVGVISLHHRNPLMLHGGDTLMRMLLIYLAVGPAGAACSLDRLIGLWKGKLSPEPPLVRLWPQRLVQYQLALVYFTTVWHKWLGTYWRDGTATWYPHQLSEFDRFWTPKFLEYQPFTSITTYGTLFIEFALATLVFWKPLRKWVLLGGLGLHGFIEYRFNIPLFAFIITSAYVCFYEGHEVSGWAKRVGERLRRFRLEVFLPAGMRLAPGRGDAVKATDAFELIHYHETQPGDDEASPNWRARNAAVTVGEEGVLPQSEKKNPMRATWQRSVGAWILGVVPGLWPKMLRNSIEPAAQEPTRPAGRSNGAMRKAAAKTKGGR